jgi:hypothetical protein
VTSNIEHKNYTSEDAQRLFDTLAESLKLPFLTIARSAELARLTGNLEYLTHIEDSSESALELLDNYLLSARLNRAGSQLVLEPVSLSASLAEAAHRLEALAKHRNCDLELHIAGKYEPIMAHSKGLAAALQSLGQVFIDAQSQQTHTTRPVIKLAAHRTRYGIVAGMFADTEGLSTDMLRRARQLYGRSRSPLVQMSANAGAEVFVVDSLLKSMSSGLRIAHHQRLSGLAATFTPSQQLELV